MLFLQKKCIYSIASPPLKKWCYTGFGLSDIPSIRHNFVSAQYLENELRVLANFVYALILTRPRLGLLLIIFLTFVTELLPLICLNFVHSFVSTPYLRTNG